MCEGSYGGRWMLEGFGGSDPPLRMLMGVRDSLIRPSVRTGAPSPEGKAFGEIATPVCGPAGNDRRKSVAGCVGFGAVGVGRFQREQAPALRVPRNSCEERGRNFSCLFGMGWYNKENS